MSFPTNERDQLAQLLHEVGPEHPTLCEGWNTHDLILHLALRQQILLVHQRDYDELVEHWRGLRIGRLLDPVMNGAEHFVHHEDVRRGAGEWSPRTFARGEEEELGKQLRRFAPVLLRRCAGPVVLEPTGGVRFTAHAKPGVAVAGDQVASVKGRPGELLLWVFGRDAVEVEVDDPWGYVKRSSI